MLSKKTSQIQDRLQISMIMTARSDLLTCKVDDELDINSEDVLTRHLLKLSEVEDQFRELTNKFEEINFKLDKLSNRLTKIQTDNQVRFEEIDAELVSINSNYNSNGSNQLSLKPKTDEQKYYLEVLSLKI